MKYSIVVPFYNEEDNIQTLHKEITSTMDALDETFEVIFVNDGSTDKTHTNIQKLQHIKYVELARNYGQTAALDAGFKASQGEYIITMDGDNQNPPNEIPKLIQKIHEGYDVVSGWRVHRKDPFLKHLASRCANILRGLLIKDGIHDSGCSLKIYKKEALQQIDLYGENHRFIPAILKMQGCKIGEVQVEHHPRLHGESKYNWKRGIKGIVDMINIWFWRKYSSRPLHIFGGCGLILSCTGGMLLFWLFYLRCFNLIKLANSILPLIAIFFMLAGIQLFVSGIIADLLVKNYFSTTKKTYYKIKNIREQ